MAFLVSFNRQLRCTEWQIELAARNDPHVYVQTPLRAGFPAP
jgi:hypothetical protein